MKKLIDIILLAVLFISCNRKPGANDALVSNCIKDVALNTSGDTNHVVLQFSDSRFVVHYYNNKPQGLLLQDIKNDSSSTSHFIRNNRGVFVSKNPDNGLINSIGYRYLNKEEGADIAIDKFGRVHFFTDWQQYNNSGVSYDVTQVNKGQIKVYMIKNGERVDSSIYQRK